MSNRIRECRIIADDGRLMSVYIGGIETTATEVTFHAVYPDECIIHGDKIEILNIQEDKIIVRMYNCWVTNEKGTVIDSYRGDKQVEEESEDD